MIVGVVYMMLLSKDTVKQGLGLIVQISMFLFAYKLINKFQSDDGIGIILLCDFRSSYSSRLHKVKCAPTIGKRYRQRSMLPAL